jgi:hypothetical protein
MKELSELTSPGAFFADAFPILAKLPVWMQTWRSRALTYHRNQADLWLGLWKELQQDIADGNAPECFVKQVSETDLEKQGITEIQGAFIAGSKYLSIFSLRSFLIMFFCGSVFCGRAPLRTETNGVS